MRWPAFSHVLAVGLGLLGIVVSVVGDSATQVPVRITTPASFGGWQPCSLEGAVADTGECSPPAGWREDTYLPVDSPGGLELYTFGDPWGTRLLAASPIWVALVAVGAVVLLLVPVIRSTAQGNPFAPGNASRLTVATGTGAGVNEPEPDTASVLCELAALLDDRGMTLVELSERTGITTANLSVLKNDRARAIRFTTLAAICAALDCQPGDILRVGVDEVARVGVRQTLS